MKKVYESTGNVHIPELKCAAPKGARVTVYDDMFTLNGVTIPVPYNFQLLLKHGLFKELTEEEAEAPEVIEEPKVLQRAERQKMKVEYAEENKIPIVVAAKTPKEDEVVQEAEVKSVDDKNMIRGMKVFQDESMPITKPLVRTSEKADEKVEAKAEAPVKAKQKPVDPKRAEAAAKLREERIKKANGSSKNKK